MELVLWLLVLQGIMGAFDNLWHHEFTENLPNTPTARNEIALHSVRELIYGVIFLMLGTFSPLLQAMGVPSRRPA